MMHTEWVCDEMLATLKPCQIIRDSAAHNAACTAANINDVAKLVFGVR